MNICALFKPLQTGGNYFNLSQYTEDLITSINNGTYIVKPTSFICANIKGGGEVTLDSNMLPMYLQNYYENSCSMYRGSGGSDNIFLSKLISTLNKFNAEYVYYGEVTLYSSNNVEGTAYNEVYCYLSPGAEKQNVVISNTSSDSITSSEEDIKIQGYHEDGYYKGDDYGTDDGSLAIYDENYTYSYDKYSGVTYTTDESNPDSFTFNTIILLYNVYDESDNVIMENIPMGVYFTGDVTNNIINNEIHKYVRNEDIYGQGSSWGIRLSNKILSTVNTQEVYTDFVEDIGGERAVFAEALDNLVNLTSTIEEKSQETQLTLQSIKTSLSTIQTAQTNVPYIVDVLVDGETVPMWFINGMNTECSSKGEDGGTVEIYNMSDILGDGESWEDIQENYQDGKSIILDDTDSDYLYLITYTPKTDGGVTTYSWNKWDLKGTAGKVGEPGYSLNISKNYKTLGSDQQFSFTYGSDGEEYFGRDYGVNNDAIFTEILNVDGETVDYINLYIYNEDTSSWSTDGLNFKGPSGSQGEAGSGVQILGSMNNASELPSDPDKGDSYIVAGNLWVWTIVNGSEYWLDCGSIVGPQGETGPAGETGSQGIQGLNFHLTSMNSDGTAPTTTTTVGNSICIDKYGDVWSYNSGSILEVVGNIKGTDGQHGSIIKRSYMWSTSIPSKGDNEKYEWDGDNGEYVFTPSTGWSTSESSAASDTTDKGNFLFMYESIFEVVESGEITTEEVWDENNKILSYIYEYKKVDSSPVICMTPPINYTDNMYTLTCGLTVPGVYVSGYDNAEFLVKTNGGVYDLNDLSKTEELNEYKEAVETKFESCLKTNVNTTHNGDEFTFDTNNVYVNNNITISDGVSEEGEVLDSPAKLIINGNVEIGDNSNFYETIYNYNGTFDKVISTQDEFDELIGSTNWLGAKSVAFVGTPLYKGSPIFEIDDDGNPKKEVVEVKSIVYDNDGLPILDADGNLTYNIEEVDKYVYKTDDDGNIEYANATYEDGVNLYGFVYLASNLLIPSSVTTIQGFEGAKIYTGAKLYYGYDYDGDGVYKSDDFYDYEKCRSITDLKVQYLDINALTGDNTTRGDINLFNNCSNLNNCEAIVDSNYTNTGGYIVNLYSNCTSVNNCWGAWDTNISTPSNINIYNNCTNVNYCGMFRLDEEGPTNSSVPVVGFNGCKNIRNNNCAASDVAMNNFTLYNNCSDIRNCYHDYENGYFTTFVDCDNIDSCEGKFEDCTRVRFSTGKFTDCYVDESSIVVSSEWSGGCNKIVE